MIPSPFTSKGDTIEFRSTTFFIDYTKNKRKDPLLQILRYLGLYKYVTKTSTIKTLCEYILKYAALFDYTITSNTSITFNKDNIIYHPFLSKQNNVDNLDRILSPFFTEMNVDEKVIKLNKILGISPHYEKKSEKEYVFRGLKEDYLYSLGDCDPSSDWDLIVGSLGFQQSGVLSPETMCTMVSKMLQNPKQVLFYGQDKLYIIRLQDTMFLVDYANPDKYLSYDDKNIIIRGLQIQKYEKHGYKNFAIKKYIRDYLNRWEILQKHSHIVPLVQRWIDFPNFFIPVKNIDIEGASFTLYKIPKDSILYHGTVKDFDIKDMTWLSFFSPHENISKMILSFTGKGWFSIEQGQLLIKSHPFLYKLRTKKDVFVIYNTNMGLPITNIKVNNKYGQFSPLSLQQSMEQFCGQHGGQIEGFFDLRDAAPIFPIFLEKPTQQDIKNIEDPVLFAHKYLKIGSYDRHDTVYTMEVILCNPRDCLELVEKKQLDGLQLLQEWRSFSTRVLTHPNRREAIDTLKYDYLLGPFIDDTRRFYSGGYVRLKSGNLISTRWLKFEDLESKEIQSLILPNKLPKGFRMAAASQFWLWFCIRNKQNPKLQEFYTSHILPFLDAATATAAAAQRK